MPGYLGPGSARLREPSGMTSERYTTEGEYPAPPYHSIWAMPAFLMISRYFTISSEWNFADLSSDSAIGSAPAFPKLSRTAGSASAAAISLLSRSRIGRGVPAGAAMANQPDTLYSGSPASVVVGVSGSAASRLSPATASAVAPLAWIGPATLGNHWNPRATVPAIRSGANCAMLR